MRCHCLGGEPRIDNRRRAGSPGVAAQRRDRFWSLFRSARARLYLRGMRWDSPATGACVGEVRISLCQAVSVGSSGVRNCYARRLLSSRGPKVNKSPHTRTVNKRVVVVWERIRDWGSPDSHCLRELWLSPALGEIFSSPSFSPSTSLAPVCLSNARVFA